MATIINNPRSDRVVEVERPSDSGGWAVAVVVLIAVIVALIVWFHYHHTVVVNPPASGGTNINVTLPGGASNTNGGTAGQ